MGFPCDESAINHCMHVVFVISSAQCRLPHFDGYESRGSAPTAGLDGAEP